MKKTLQDQYLLIKEGKGHKGVFLSEAKRQFPDIVRNAATFNEAAASLITKKIISENVIGLGAINSPFEVKKKQSFETAFESFLAEAKKKENEEEKVKAEEKKVSKPVEEDYARNFDRKDDKNIDNLIFDQVMTGYYAEMKDPKNADKTMQELKDIVMKNLQKDPIYYTKDGQFGVKGLGYTTEAPGLGEPKEAKGKYKSSGYGDLKEGVEKFMSDVEDLATKKKDSKFTDKEKADKILQRKKEDHKRRKEAGEPYDETLLREAIRKMIDEELNSSEFEDTLFKLEQPHLGDKAALTTIQKIYSRHSQGLNSAAQNLGENYESLDYYTSIISSNNMSEEEAYAYLEDQGLNSRQIDSIIDQAFPDNMDEAYQLVNINPIKSDKERGEREPQPFKMSYVNPSVIDSLTKNQHLRILRNPSNPENITLAIRATLAPTSDKNLGKTTDNLNKLPLDIVHPTNGGPSVVNHDILDCELSDILI
jgi:hypothetical protein